MLQRFYETTSGSVLVDGRDVRDMGINELRNQMGYVSQEAILFEDTIRWNLMVSTSQSFTPDVHSDDRR